MSSLCGGRFDLPEKAIKLVNKAESTNHNERIAIIDKLWSWGYFLDKVGIVWDRNQVPEIARRTDNNYSRLAGIGEQS
jgi:hypothetical protein